ncbi:MAG: hypothetical protein KAS63_10410 [Candidatus Heimdallarchaeota archaeon]|nr:hypothetical protein [Candidatus Heimdallarchaeota archaeon]MCK4955766.1 hypothetical protein [Candidatus Heimdallarchaeota archaeon]
MISKITEKTPIQKNTILLLSGSILIIISGLLNIVDQIFIGWSYRIPALRYILFCFTVVGLIPIAFGLRNITEMYFIEHITNVGNQAFTWLLFYSVAVVLDIVLIGWPITAPFVGYAIIFGRVLGFLKMNKTFVKINDVFNLKLGGIFYILFAWYSVIVSIMNSVANWAQDVTFEVGMFALKGLIETILLVIVGIKLIIDSQRIKRFIQESNIKPYSTKRTLFVKDSSTLTRSKLGKEHLQAQTQLAKLREKTEKRSLASKQKRKKVKHKRISEEQIKQRALISKGFITCTSCGERTDKYLKNCINCGHTFQKHERISTEKSLMEAEQSRKFTKRLLTAKNEKIFQQIVIVAALIAFSTYAFVTRNATLVVYAWIIIAILGTYLVVNYIILFFVGRGFAITSILSDIAFLFIIIPVISAILSYFIFQGTLSYVVTKMDDPVYNTLFILTTFVISIICILVLLRFRIRSSNMGFKEYIKYRFDFKERAKELAKEEKRAERKRYYFDQLDRIEARMNKQKESKVMAYEDFDFKQRLKDLGSPLEDEENE